MVSPLGPVLANIFRCHFEEKWVLNNNARSSVWFRYVDDTFTSVFNNKNKATQVLHYLNNCHANIKFTVEFEENSTIPFLDILIRRHNHTFSTSIYRKKTFTGLYTKWESFTHRKYKVNLIRTLTFRCFRIRSSPSLLRSCQSRPQSLRSFWPAVGIESSGSNHYERTKEITEFWLSGSLRICIYGACLKWLLPELSFSDCWSKGTRLWERDCDLVLRTFAPIVSAHPYCARKCICHVIHQACAQSTKINK